MTDDRLELPLFEPPDRDHEDDLDSLFDDDPRPPESGQRATGAERTGTAKDSPPAEDDPIVIEPLDLPEPSELPTAEMPEIAALSPPQPAGVGSRMAAGLIDLLVHIALAGILIGGSSLLDAPIGWQHILPLSFVAGIFSFVYHVVPLAFWGRTPGMAVAGLRARTLDDEPLSLPQATKRWVALLVTAATGGLGVLLALGGRSLADRLSGSQTLLQ